MTFETWHITVVILMAIASSLILFWGDLKQNTSNTFFTGTLILIGLAWLIANSMQAWLIIGLLSMAMLLIVIVIFVSHRLWIIFWYSALEILLALALLEPYREQIVKVLS